MAPALSKEFLDIQANYILDMITSYRQAFFIVSFMPGHWSRFHTSIIFGSVFMIIFVYKKYVQEFGNPKITHLGFYQPNLVQLFPISAFTKIRKQLRTSHYYLLIIPEKKTRGNFVHLHLQSILARFVRFRAQSKPQSFRAQCFFLFFATFSSSLNNFLKFHPLKTKFYLPVNLSNTDEIT